MLSKCRSALYKLQAALDLLDRDSHQMLDDAKHRSKSIIYPGIRLNRWNMLLSNTLMALRNTRESVLRIPEIEDNAKDRTELLIRYETLVERCEEIHKRCLEIRAIVIIEHRTEEYIHEYINQRDRATREHGAPAWNFGDPIE